ncbi:hypothetical protein A6R68_20151 [Neotoma lepida]|uniref:Uncharacterized protein n=1 Tax=Neotoma lepida TaxID=56216 RepID=A0A1A6HTM8_NEOLE|nr:hypothetical protein A6R68_20151 [Neotoma lepida]
MEAVVTLEKNLKQSSAMEPMQRSPPDPVQCSLLPPWRDERASLHTLMPTLERGPLESGRSDPSQESPLLKDHGSVMENLVRRGQLCERYCVPLDNTPHKLKPHPPVASTFIVQALALLGSLEDEAEADLLQVISQPSPCPQI